MSRSARIAIAASLVAAVAVPALLLQPGGQPVDLVQMTLEAWSRLPACAWVQNVVHELGLPEYRGGQIDVFPQAEGNLGDENYSPPLVPEGTARAIDVVGATMHDVLFAIPSLYLVLPALLPREVTCASADVYVDLNTPALVSLQLTVGLGGNRADLSPEGCTVDCWRTVEINGAEVRVPAIATVHAIDIRPVRKYLAVEDPTPKQIIDALVGPTVARPHTRTVELDSDYSGPSSQTFTIQGGVQWTKVASVRQNVDTSDVDRFCKANFDIHQCPTLRAYYALFWGSGHNAGWAAFDSPNAACLISIPESVAEGDLVNRAEALQIAQSCTVAADLPLDTGIVSSRRRLYSEVVRATPGRLLHWRLDDPEGATMAQPDFGIVYYGTYSGRHQRVPGVELDTYGRYFVPSFDGGPAGFVHRSALGLTTPAWTLELWVKPWNPADGLHPTQVVAGNANPGGYVVYYDQGNLTACRMLAGDNNLPCVRAAPVVSNTYVWHHVVLTYDPAENDPNGGWPELYVDGVLYDDTFLLNPLGRFILPGGGTPGAEFVVGRWWNYWDPYALDCNCSVDDVVIYGRKLTPAEVEAHWLAGNVGNARIL